MARGALANGIQKSRLETVSSSFDKSVNAESLPRDTALQRFIKTLTGVTVADPRTTCTSSGTRGSLSRIGSRSKFSREKSPISPGITCKAQEFISMTMMPQGLKNSGLSNCRSDLTPDRSESSTDAASIEQLSGLTGPTFDRNFDVIWRFQRLR